MPSPNKQDYRDYVVLGLVTGIVAAATVFLFLFPSSQTFGIWSGVVSATYGAYHWLCVSDDKRTDAGNVTAVLPNTLSDVFQTHDWKEDKYVRHDP